MRYRSISVEKEAFQWTGDEHQTEEPQWIVDAIKNKKVTFIHTGSPVVKLLIHTLEGTMTADRGDYIIQGLQGELYPCKPDIFEKSYEKID